MIATASAIMILLAQEAGARVDAEYPQEGWALEYPALIGGFVDGYYNCLKGGSYVVGDGPGFEDQYRGDIRRCGEQAVEMEAGANALLAKRARAAETPPTQVAEIFETVRRIHVERGASLDRATSSRIVASHAYAEARAASAKAPPACVAQVNALRDARQSYMESEGQKAKRIVMAYNAELLRQTNSITAELRSCPEANYRVYQTSDDADPAKADG